MHILGFPTQVKNWQYFLKSFIQYKRTKIFKLSVMPAVNEHAIFEDNNVIKTHLLEAC
jgi:hypothetical protein